MELRQLMLEHPTITGTCHHLEFYCNMVNLLLIEPIMQKIINIITRETFDREKVPRSLYLLKQADKALFSPLVSVIVSD